MKTKIVALMLLVVAFLPSVIAVSAPWSTLGTGYAITSNYHGVPVPPMTPVTVTAGTLDTRVTQVTFRWHRPSGGSVNFTAAVFTNGTTGQWNNGTTAEIRYAISTYTPDELGDWGVQAFFQDTEGRTRAEVENTLKIRATSFYVTPEIPSGTIGAIAMMTAALALVALNRKAALPLRP